jgi:hypothetical protein
MVLILAGFGLILIPLNIATRAPQGWATDYIIAMIVVGVVCLVLSIAFSCSYIRHHLLSTGRCSCNLGGSWRGCLAIHFQFCYVSHFCIIEGRPSSFHDVISAVLEQASSSISVLWLRLRNKMLRYAECYHCLLITYINRFSLNTHLTNVRVAAR